VTFDLGYKAVASDPPAGKRLHLLDLAEYEAVLQNEEHLAIETPGASRFQLGAEAYAMPTHICPTVAMHRFAYVIEGGNLPARWEIVARDRLLTVCWRRQHIRQPSQFGPHLGQRRHQLHRLVPDRMQDGQASAMQSDHPISRRLGLGTKGNFRSV